MHWYGKSNESFNEKADYIDFSPYSHFTRFANLFFSDRGGGGGFRVWVREEKEIGDANVDVTS